MGVFTKVIGDIAVVAVFAAFIDMFLPKARQHYGIKLVFGLYFLAILLNPVVGLFTDMDFSTLDFSQLAIEEGEILPQEADSSVLEAASQSLSAEIETKLEAVYEEYDFYVMAVLGNDSVESVTAEVSSVEPGRERVVADKVKTILAEDYGIEKRKVEVVFK